MRQAGDFVAYAGSRERGIEAAQAADVVFARAALWERLRDDHPRVVPFETFHDVVAVLEREAEGWTGER
jgi:2-hydroxy-3-keto-5-methylthiopentenyl-1-phosphate phosphatase